jgi:hypothetical protein
MSAHRFVARCAAVAAAAAIASLGFSTATQAAAFPVRGRVPAVIKTITVGSRPDGIAVSPVTGEVYGLCCVAISPVTGQAYISSADTNQVFILNGRTNDPGPGIRLSHEQSLPVPFARTQLHLGDKPAETLRICPIRDMNMASALPGVAEV